MAFREIIADDEVQRFEGYGAWLSALQKERVAKGGKMQRALHVKHQLGVVGSLTVSAPEALRTGVFAETGKTFPVYVHCTNGGAAHQSDKAPNVRGIALKLVGVEGKKLIAGLENEVTQDFLFLNDPALPFRDPEEFMGFVRAAKGHPALLLPRLLGEVGLGRGLAILRTALSSAKVSSYATHAFHTCAPLTLGGTAAKLALFPQPTAPRPVPSGDNYLREDLVARVSEGPLSWSLRAQLFVDEQTTPIEDTSVVWSGPWHELGTFTIPKQDPSSAKGVEISEYVESLSFDPWHALEAHKPLGAIMRARGHAYKASVITRNAAPEPKSVHSL